jgi:hypothetical protein
MNVKSIFVKRDGPSTSLDCVEAGGFSVEQTKKDSIPFQPEDNGIEKSRDPRPKITKHRGREEGRNEKRWQGEVAAFVASATSLAGETTTTITTMIRTIQQSTNVGTSSRIGHGTNNVQ